MNMSHYALAILLLGAACDLRPDKKTPDNKPSADVATPAGPTVRLKGGATLRLPGSATPHRVPKRLPAQVTQSRVFRVGGETKLSMINELKLDKPCKQALDGEWQRMKKAKADTDDARLKVRRIGAIEELRLAGRRVLYAETSQRGFAKLADGGRPSRQIATMLFCEGDNQVALMFAVQQPALPAGAKRMLSNVVSSYRPAAQPSR